MAQVGMTKSSIKYTWQASYINYVKKREEKSKEKENLGFQWITHLAESKP